jgi:hypothetical protein
VNRRAKICERLDWKKMYSDYPYLGEERIRENKLPNLEEMRKMMRGEGRREGGKRRRRKRKGGGIFTQEIWPKIIAG